MKTPTYKARYTVHVISNGDMGVMEPGETLLVTDDAAEAKSAARAHAGNYYFGTCICDHEERTTDWGDNVTPWEQQEAE